MNNQEFPTVPLAAFEAAQERHSRTVRNVAVAWAITTLALCVTLAIFVLF